MIRGRDGGGLGQSGSSRGDKKHLNSRYILKVELIEFANRLDGSVR